MQYVPQDTAKLIELQGGPDKFVQRLDWIFENVRFNPDSVALFLRFTQNYFDSTNEPSQQIPHMYHYANQPGRTAQRVRQIIGEAFNTSVNGLPGNDGEHMSFIDLRKIKLNSWQILVKR